MNIDIGKYARACFGERVIGDEMLVEEKNDLTFIAVIDGIGHGVTANSVSTEIKNYLALNWIDNPAYMIKKTHDYIAGSQGAVIGIAVINRNTGDLTFSGLGNIACRIIGKNNVTMVSADGLLGVSYRTVSNTKIKLHGKDIVLIHSDGVSTNFYLDNFPSYSTFSPPILAKKIVQKFGNEYDDASCVVVKVTNES